MTFLRLFIWKRLCWESGSNLCGKLVTVQGNKVNAKNNPEARLPGNVQIPRHPTTSTTTTPYTHARAHACTHHCPGLMLQNPNQSSQLPENMTWPFRFTEHQLWVGLACFPFQRTLCPSRPLRHPRGPKPSTNNYSRWSLHSTRQSQKSLTLILTHT